MTHGAALRAAPAIGAGMAALPHCRHALAAWQVAAPRHGPARRNLVADKGVSGSGSSTARRRRAFQPRASERRVTWFRS
jgi:hypothetical protein